NAHALPGSAPASFWLPRHPLSVYLAGISDSASVRCTDSVRAGAPSHSGIWKLTTASNSSCGAPAGPHSEADHRPLSVALLGRQLDVNGGPSGPVGPVGPPEGPVAPVAPALPSGPVTPVAPVALCAPVGPVEPVRPSLPSLPSLPSGPVAPVAPV